TVTNNERQKFAMQNIFGPKRKTIRLPEFDYALDGHYYVTICTQNRHCHFGAIEDGEMYLTPVGEMVQRVWMDLPKYHPRIGLDEFIVMPNHVHGIVVLKPESMTLRAGIEPRAGTELRAGTRPAPTVSLFDVVRIFKSVSTVEYIRGVKYCAWPPIRQ